MFDMKTLVLSMLIALSSCSGRYMPYSKEINTAFKPIDIVPPRVARYAHSNTLPYVNVSLFNAVPGISDTLRFSDADDKLEADILINTPLAYSPAWTAITGGQYPIKVLPTDTVPTIWTNVVPEIIN